MKRNYDPPIVMLTHNRLTDRLPINRDAALIIINMHPAKQVHSTNFQLNTKPMLAMNFTVSSLRLSITLRVIHSSGQAELERLVRQHLLIIKFKNPSKLQLDLAKLSKLSQINIID